MTSRFNTWFAVLLIVVGVPYYWLFVDNRPGEPEPRPVSIALLRELAEAIPGKMPVSITYESVAHVDRPRNIVAAGRGFRPVRLHALVYRLEVPDKAPIMIGAGLTARQANALDFDASHPSAQARVLASLSKAGALVPLNAGKAQIGNLDRLEQIDPGRAKALAEGLVEAGPAGTPYAVAPGVVVIPTPERSPDAQMVYVRLADGRHYLFAGDMAQTRWNIDEIRAPARYVTDVLGDFDRSEIYAWLITIRQIEKQAPGLAVVPGGEIPTDIAIDRGFPGQAAK